MKLMQVWIVCFVVFFAAAELYQWVQGITLPLPVLVVAGALLAVISNSHLFLRKQTSLQPVSPSTQTDAAPSIVPASIPASSAESNPESAPLFDTPPCRYYPGAQLPNLHAQRSISFNIQKSSSVNEEADPGEG